MNIKPEKLIEHTYGTHIYMKMCLDNGRVESIDVYFRNDGIYYETSADIGIEFSTGEELEKWKALRQKIIDTFNLLYKKGGNIMNKNNYVKGYKVFNPDWTCRGFQYEVGKIFEEDVKPKCCNRGFHFCTKASDCFNYYSFNPENKVAEILALGDVDTQSDDTKCCTNKIHIMREISWQELLGIVNTGKGCTGFRNTGDYNTGHYNTGDYNTGDYNTGHYNTGHYNTGHRNTGHRNTGDYNTGDFNTGDYNTGDFNTGHRNTGDFNTGDYNLSSFNTGCFATIEQKIMLFNKPSDITYRDWINSDARRLLNRIPENVVEWMYENDMSDEEKAANPTYETTGGYLKILDKSECAQLWWDGLSNNDKNIIKNLPNFDADIFEKCTGIKID